MAMRATPDYTVLRPADANETAAAWQLAVQHDAPVDLVLTRQGLPILDPARVTDDAIERGGDVLRDPDRAPDVTLMATGPEVHLAIDAAEALAGEDVAVLGLDRFGLSGLGEKVYAELGFTTDRVVDTVHDVLEGTPRPAAAAS